VIAIEKETDTKVVMTTNILHPIETVMADMAVILLTNEKVQVPPLHLVNLASPEEEDPPAISHPWIPQPHQVYPPNVIKVLIL
jgi:hypothetical protein